MWFPSIFQKPGFSKKPGFSAPAKPRRALRLRLEQLEDRTLPSNFFAATVSDLIADINAANKAGGSNTITLTAPTTSPYVLTAADNTTDGPTGLPVIKGGNKPDSLTIIGNGDTIERSTASGTPDFRLFDVASGASLTLQNLTLENGLAIAAFIGGVAKIGVAEGGAVYNQGTLVLSGVIVQQNGAFGFDGQKSFSKSNPSGDAGEDAFGGGIWSGGALTCDNGTVIKNNTAQGGRGGNANPGSLTGSGGNAGNAAGGGIWSSGALTCDIGTLIENNTATGGNGGNAPPFTNGIPHGGNGGNASGGGVYMAGGTANLTGVTLSGNQARGGQGGNGSSNFDGGGNNGNANGGGLDAAAGTVTLCNVTVQNNTVQQGFGGALGSAFGGGIFIAAGATVYIDSFTVTNTINNTDNSGLNSSTANIDGTYILKNC
jgi:hypothetical protein